MSSPKHTTLALLVLAAVGLAACGGTAFTSGNDEDDDGLSDPLMCELPAEGALFTFEVRNTGERDLLLTYGCGTTMPIQLNTSDGPLGIGPGNADFCEVDCEAVYDGYDNWGCSDCGPGYGTLLLPGESTTIEWSRRVFKAHQAPVECTTAEGRNCALGVPVDAATVTTGTLDVCPTEFGNVSGYCGQEKETVPFTIDLTKDTLLLEVK